jgi:TRAP-type mannitol/chloroaromatic compound transport system substrate-binding protein
LKIPPNTLSVANQKLFRPTLFARKPEDSPELSHSRCEPSIASPRQAAIQLGGFSEEIMETCYRAANEVYAEVSAQNPSFKKVYDSLVAFRSYLWWQVAEMSFDSFQVRLPQERDLTSL